MTGHRPRLLQEMRARRLRRQHATRQMTRLVEAPEIVRSLYHTARSVVLGLPPLRPPTVDTWDDRDDAIFHAAQQHSGLFPTLYTSDWMSPDYQAATAVFEAMERSAP